MQFGRDSSAGYLANHMARLFAKALQQRLRATPVTPGVMPALLALAEHDGQTQGELVAVLDIEQATMARTLMRMERDGLIRRKPHPDDARKQVVLLRGRARELLPVVLDAAQQINADALAPLDPDERRKFLGMMQRVIAALGG